MVDCLPNLHLLDTGQMFPRYTYEQQAIDPDLFTLDAAPVYSRQDNVTDEILADYRRAYGLSVNKDDIFYHVYGLLHSPEYRARFAADLKRMLPRIPKVATAQDFNEYVKAGRELAALHVGYENVEPYPLHEVTTSTLATVGKDFYRVQKMRFSKNRKIIDKSAVIYNSHVTLTGIPDEAHEYMLGPKSAIEWIMDRYQLKTDKASGIVNDPNDWAAEVGDPRYILDLLKRIVTVSVETMKIVKSLPTLKLIS